MLIFFLVDPVTKEDWARSPWLWAPDWAQFFTVNTAFKKATSYPGYLSYRLYDACALANVSRGAMGTRVNPDTCRIRVDGQTRLKTDACRRGNCGIQKEKVEDSKLSGYLWTGREWLTDDLMITLLIELFYRSFHWLTLVWLATSQLHGG